MIPPYKNEHGEIFTITFTEPPVPDRADYWGFGFLVTDAENRKKWYRVVIKKSFIPDKDGAKHFATNTALDDLRGQLEHVQDGVGPIFFPDLDKGWVVF